jgi:hypothetical protein
MAQNETIFLTGFPGFIAGRLVRRLASEGARFLLLVQPAFMEKARADAARLASETRLAPENFRLVEGDITRPDLGVRAPELELARVETTLLFHLAAVYDLAVPRDLGLRVNVGGTRNVNEFALALPHLRRYHYVSTCYVAGKRAVRTLETGLRHEAGFRTSYAAPTCLAERAVGASRSAWDHAAARLRGSGAGLRAAHRMTDPGCDPARAFCQRLTTVAPSGHPPRRKRSCRSEPSVLGGPQYGWRARPGSAPPRARASGPRTALARLTGRCSDG